MTKTENKSIKMTFKQIKLFVDTYNELCDNNGAIPNSKFGYAVNKFIKSSLEQPLKEYNLALADVRIENALEDPETKAVLTKEGTVRGYQYDKKGLKNVIKQENAVADSWEDKEFVVEPYICTKDAPEMNEQQMEAFKGFVI